MMKNLFNYKMFAVIWVSMIFFSFVQPVYPGQKYFRHNMSDTVPTETLNRNKSENQVVGCVFVELEASPDKSWQKYLRSQLQPAMENAAAKGMVPGTYTVRVRFLVQKDGSIDSVKALNDPGFGLAEAATETIRSGPKWNPAIVGGRKTRCWRTQPIIFIITEPEKTSASLSMQPAITDRSHFLSSPIPHKLPGSVNLYDSLWETVETPAEIDSVVWNSFLQKKLTPFLTEASSRGMKPGVYSILVKFRIEKDGTITYAEARNDPGFDLAKNLVEIFKKGPTWKPSTRNGRNVRFYRRQEVRFIAKKPCDGLPTETFML
jgi:hypothetical protein